MNLEQQFKKLKTPQELLMFLKTNIKYGWTGKDNVTRLNTIAGFRSQFRLSSTSQILNSGVGTCFEQVELSREFFNNQNIKSISFAIIGGRMIHTFIVFMINGLYYKLENADVNRSGIFKFESIEELLIQETQHFMEYRKLNSLDKVTLVEYGKISDFTDYNGIFSMFINPNIKNIIKDIYIDEAASYRASSSIR